MFPAKILRGGQNFMTDYNILYKLALYMLSSSYIMDFKNKISIEGEVENENFNTKKP